MQTVSNAYEQKNKEANNQSVVLQSFMHVPLDSFHPTSIVSEFASPF